MTERAHGMNLRLHRRMNAPGTWFVTKCVEPRMPVLTEGSTADVIVNALAHRVKNGSVVLGGFAVMPDHWHALLAVDALPTFMHGIGTWIGGHTTAALCASGTEWQANYFDTRIRSTRQFVFVRSYIEENPVRKGLCAVPEDWCWSSANKAFRDMVTRPWPWDFEGDHE